MLHGGANRVRSEECPPCLPACAGRRSASTLDSIRDSSGPPGIVRDNEPVYCANDSDRAESAGFPGPVTRLNLHRSVSTSPAGVCSQGETLKDRR